MQFEDIMRARLGEAQAVVRFQEYLRHERGYSPTSFRSEYALTPSLRADLAIVDNEGTLRALVEFKLGRPGVRDAPRSLHVQIQRHLLALPADSKVRIFAVLYNESEIEVREYSTDSGELIESPMAHFPAANEVLASNDGDSVRKSIGWPGKYGKEKAKLFDAFDSARRELSSLDKKGFLPAGVGGAAALLSEVNSQLTLRFTDLSVPEPWRSDEELFVSAATFSEYLKKELAVDKNQKAGIPIDVRLVIQALQRKIEDVIQSEKMQGVGGLVAPSESGMESVNPKPDPVDILVVVAMMKPEFEELMSVVANAVHEQPFETSDHSYCMRGTLDGSSASVIVATQDNMGMTNAAVLVTKLVLHYQPKYVVMTGIAAGIDPKDQQVGDVLVPSHTYDIALGKLDVDKDDVIFKPKIYQKDARDHLNASGKVLASKWDAEFKKLWSAELQAAYPEQFSTLIKRPIDVHNGPFGSGGTVIAYEKEAELYKQTNNAIIGFDMEAHAVVTAAAECGLLNKPQVLVAKAICDFAGGDKRRNKGAKQVLAARSSALYFQLFFLRYILGQNSTALAA
ncbi:phosphorylase family protein [Paraburkholderia caledonica]|uniref:Nucleoside phosphorylase n=1 Tax=Paraburkholderia caledonica TaxID=134536 RepID=A0AB73I607_9BURK|nr:nucleoside phosphorylase [Paraburkholderia caledonica]